MFLRSIGIDSTTLVVLVVIVLASSLQALLCFKAKQLLLRAIPLAGCITLSLIFYIICRRFTSGWDSIGYLGLVFLFAALSLVCAVTWFFCALIIGARGERL